MKSTTYICGIGGYVPSKVLTNDDLSKIVETDDEWIVTRTGIRERHILPAGEFNSDMGLAASTQALKDAGVAASEITHILYASCTTETVTPSGACALSHKLGIKNVFALDLNAACSGFVYGLSVADAMLHAHPDATVLLVAADALSTRTNWEDRTTCVLFGDGAGAIVLRNKKSPVAPFSAEVLGVSASSDASLGDLLHFRNGFGGGYKLGETVGPEFYIQMQGREVFKHAVRGMVALSVALLQQHGYTPADVDLLIPHQANLRIIEAVGTRLEISGDRVFVNVQTKGNTSAASIPLALSEAITEGRIKPGMLVLMTTFGGGLTCAAGLVRF